MTKGENVTKPLCIFEHVLITSKIILVGFSRKVFHKENENFCGFLCLSTVSGPQNAGVFSNAVSAKVDVMLTS